MIRKNTIAYLALLILFSGCECTKKICHEEPIITPMQEESSLTIDFEKNVGDRIFFDFDKSDLSNYSKEQLYKQVSWLREHPNVYATIEGHCDQRGTREYNLALGERRARAVQEFLLGHGIEANRLDIISYGKERPAVVGDDEMAWAENRRSVISVRN